MIPISEIKYSISGEGKSAGYPVIIVRTAGCNLDKPCSYCDTSYAWKKEQGTLMTDEEIINRVADVRLCNRILLTGGEPLWHDIDDLCELFIEGDYDVEIETNGSIDIVAHILPSEAVIVMDIKTPSSGNSNMNHYPNLAFLSEDDQVKFVIGDRKDFDFALHVLKSYKRREFPHVLFSPVWGKIEGKTLAEWIMNDYPEGQLSLQLHKIVGVA